MNAKEARTVEFGDRLTPNEEWNRTERTRKLPDVITVDSIRHECRSQTGVMVEVIFLNGTTAWLDLGWFEVCK